jgi:protein NrfD
MLEKTYKILSRVWAVFFVIGLIALIMKFMTGEKLAGYGSYVPWGLWVALYFHFVGIAGGVFALGAIGYFFNITGFRKNFRVIIIVSVASVITGLFSIWLDLGQPFRFSRMMYAPNFGSMMAFNGWMYSIFIIVAGLLFYLTIKREKQTDLQDKSGWLIPLMALGFLFSIAFPSQSGAFFGVVDAKPFWSSPLLPILFLISAITSGGAVLLLVYTFLAKQAEFNINSPLERMLRFTIIGGIIIYFIAEFAEYSLVFWSPNSHVKEAVELILFGPFWWVFWFVHILGSLIGLILLLKGKSPQIIGSGAFIIAVTFVSARLNILIPGQAVSELKGLKDAFYHERLKFDYVATLNEYLIALFIGSFGVALAYFGIKFLSKYTQKKLGASL